MHHVEAGEVVCLDRVAVTTSGERTIVYGVESMKIARAARGLSEPLRDYASMGHASRLSPADRALLDRLHSSVQSVSSVEAPDETDPVVTRLNIGNTYHCNMGCTYCYNELDLKDRKGSEVPIGMTLETSKQTIDALFEHAPDRRAVSLVFIGGEALLERKTLFATIEYAEQLAERDQRRLSVAIYTNGTLMNRGVIEWCNDHDVSLVVSLDGPPEINDVHRIFRAGRPTSAAVLRNIAKLMAYSTQTLRRVRAVAVRSIDLVALHRYLMDLGFNEIHVQPMYDESGISTAVAGDEMTELLAWYIQQLRSGRIISVLPFESFFERFLAQGKAVTSWYPCTAGRSSLGVGPDGKIYPCHHFLEEGTFELGHVSNGIPDLENRSPFFMRVDERTPCRDCWARHACGGECYHRAHTAGAGYTGVLEPVCVARKTHIGMALEAFATLAQECPDALRALACKQYSELPSNPAAFEAADLSAYT